MKKRPLAVSMEDAQKTILGAVSPLACEKIPISEAYNRVLCEDIISDIMLPPVDDSAMDGYAVIAEETLGATRDNPVRLPVEGEIQAGDLNAGRQVIKGTAVRIMTGAPMPEGADSVIRFEDTEEEGGHVKIFRPSARYDNYRKAGENINMGDRVLTRGDRMSSADVGILASLNCNSVTAYRRPVVSIISTGDELIEVGEERGPGQIRNVNAYTLCAEIRRYDAIPDYLGIAKDTFNATREIFLRALQADMVISTGGVSMGRYDFVREIFSDLDIQILFERVRVKPGGPCTFGKRGDKPVFGLPGNPVSTLTSFTQFVRPALLRLMGATRIHKPVVTALLDRDISDKRPGKAYILRGHFHLENGEFHVSTTGSQKTSALSSMSSTNCLIIIPEHVTGARAGERVAIQLIDHAEI